MTCFLNFRGKIIFQPLFQVEDEKAGDLNIECRMSMSKSGQGSARTMKPMSTKMCPTVAVAVKKSFSYLCYRRWVVSRRPLSGISTCCTGPEQILPFVCQMGTKRWASINAVTPLAWRTTSCHLLQNYVCISCLPIQATWLARHTNQKVPRWTRYSKSTLVRICS
jgi:hypothetical protein